MGDVYQIKEEQRNKNDRLCFKIHGLGLLLDCLANEPLENLSNERVSAVSMSGKIIQDLSGDILDIMEQLERQEVQHAM